ncbi:ABC transporter substrate-binding protein [Streptosporangium soli]|nr:ABC transporter substrate-binding protein [Streptosporangium sp. KLBMP 9127]
MESFIQRRKSLTALMITICLAASACGGGGAGTSGPQAQENGPPRPGGTLTVAMPSDAPTLDPHKSSSFNTHERLGLVYSRLLKQEIGPDVPYGKAKNVGDLAEKWEVAENGLTYTFHLRKGVRWHDVAPVNGREFVAGDVVATFERIQKQGFQAQMLRNVTSVKASDEHTVVLKLSKPFAPLLNFMANHHMWILPKEAVDGTVNLDRQAIGTGPFVLERWDRDVAAVYKKNPTYYDTGKPYLDGVVFKVVPNQGARVAAFRSGESQLVSASTPEEALALKQAAPNATMLDLLSSAPVQVYFNMKREPFDDLKVRKAISLAIDREGLAKALFDGGKYPGPVQVTQEEYALPQDELKQLQGHDQAKAKQLLAEAGLPNGFSTNMIVTPGYGPQYVRLAEWVVEDLAKIGIKVKLEVVEYATYFSSRWPGKQYDMGLGLQTPFLEPDEFLRDQLHSEGSRNWYNISDPKLDDLLIEQTTLLDEAERTEKVKEIQRYVLENLVNPIYVWTVPSRVLINESVRDFHPQPAYGYPELVSTWMVSR